MAPPERNPFLSSDGVRRVAELARLAVPEEELPALISQMEKIVAHVDRLRDLPEELLPDPELPAETVLRVDAPTEGGGDRELEANARTMAHGHVVVPRVIGGAP
jgi:aspartyl-tRNA(Asn)/glutamyl-tRNA(Gln) amidotransferase subunit C